VSVAQYLLAHGATKNAAAGIAGVIAGESGGNPEILEEGGGGGEGLLQWTPGSSASPYQPIITGDAAKDMATQLADMMGYISGRGGLGSINAAGSAIGAADVFSLMEAPAVQYSDVDSSAVASMVAQGYASGGATSAGWKVLGEQGRELVKMPGGAHVYPAGQSAQMAAGGAAPQNITLQVVGGGASAFDTFMTTWMREKVRVQGGGDVQKAFGRH
jgi:hypothetical protein